MLWASCMLEPKPIILPLKNQPLLFLQWHHETCNTQWQTSESSFSPHLPQDPNQPAAALCPFFLRGVPPLHPTFTIWIQILTSRTGTSTEPHITSLNKTVGVTSQLLRQIKVCESIWSTGSKCIKAVAELPGSVEYLLEKVVRICTKMILEVRSHFHVYISCLFFPPEMSTCGSWVEEK